MKTELQEFECDECLGDKLTGTGFSGLTLAYAISIVEGEVFTLCEYSVKPVFTLGPTEDPRETRAYREMLKTRGKDLPKIEKNALRNELVILPGAAISPAEVVEALKRFIKRVEKDGLQIGKYEDDFIREKISGEPRFVSEFGRSLG